MVGTQAFDQVKNTSFQFAFFYYFLFFIQSKPLARAKFHICFVQLAGIRFMWENIVQSIRKVKSGDKGLGCILAHTMGLGKTFQVLLYSCLPEINLNASGIITFF